MDFFNSVFAPIGWVVQLLGAPCRSWALLGAPGRSWALLGASGRSWAFLGSAPGRNFADTSWFGRGEGVPPSLTPQTPQLQHKLSIDTVLILRGAVICYG